MSGNGNATTRTIGAATVLALLGAIGGATVRSTIGAGTSSYVDPLTTNGDLVVRAGGVTTRLGAASAPDGGVLTVAGGAPQWAAPSSSGAAVGSGTLAARPSTPSLGDRYSVTSGANVGSSYVCRVAGSWELDRVAPPSGITPAFYLDAERVAGQSFVLLWPGEVGGAWAVSLNADPGVTVTENAGGGLPGVTTSTTTKGLRLSGRPATGSSARWIALVVSRISGPGDSYENLVVYGTAGGSALFGITSRTAGVNNYGLVYFGAETSTSTARDTGTTPVLLLAQYTGTVATLYRNGVSIGSSTIALSTGTQYGLTIGTNVAGTGEKAGATYHALLGGDGVLDSTARDAILARSQARFGVP